MNQKKLHCFINWCAIIIFLLSAFFTTTTEFFWSKFTYIVPVPVFWGLCLLFLNHVSIKKSLQDKETEFLLLCLGILFGGINLLIIRSNFGAFFTITNFLLILYLANKVQFDKIQLGLITIFSFLILFYWLFINKDSYGNTPTNPNRVSLYIFIYFCTFLCSSIYLLSYFYQVPKKYYYIALFLLFLITANRIWSFHCRSLLLATIVWAITFYFLPKKKYTIPLVIGSSLLMPIIYVLLWKSGSVDGVTVLGKRFASGRDIIWYEFFKAFIHYPITGIGSDFERMLPELYLREVHHALLNLLFVHGIPVFLIVLYFLYKRIENVILSSSGLVRSVCLASIYGIITAGSFENYYIVSPYNALFLIIFIISHISEQDPKQEDN